MLLRFSEFIKVGFCTRAGLGLVTLALTEAFFEVFEVELAATVAFAVTFLVALAVLLLFLCKNDLKKSS